MQMSNYKRVSLHPLIFFSNVFTIAVLGNRETILQSDDDWPVRRDEVGKTE